MIYIYKLIDPRTNDPRYVGKAVNPKKRLKGHCSVHPGRVTRCSLWLNELRMLGLRPLMEIVEELPDTARWAPREQHWIDKLKAEGYDILNQAPAGATPKVGHVVSEATREKLRQRFKGRPLTQAQKDAISKAQKGRKHSKEDIEKSRLGLMRTLAARGPVKYSAERVAKIMEGRRNSTKKRKPYSEEYRAKMSANRRKWWARVSAEDRSIRMRGIRLRNVPPWRGSLVENSNSA